MDEVTINGVCITKEGLIAGLKKEMGQRKELVTELKKLLKIKDQTIGIQNELIEELKKDIAAKDKLILLNNLSFQT